MPMAMAAANCSSGEPLTTAAPTPSTASPPTVSGRSMRARLEGQEQVTGHRWREKQVAAATSMEFPASIKNLNSPAEVPHEKSLPIASFGLRVVRLGDRHRWQIRLLQVRR